jgi:hypothetical protein
MTPYFFGGDDIGGFDYSEYRFIYMYDRLRDVSMSAMAEKSDQSTKRGNAR